MKAPQTMEAAIPSGHTKLVIAVQSGVVTNIGTTAVFCRPSQLQQAAIVTSCIDPQSFTPLFVITAPPFPHTEYLGDYNSFHTTVQVTVQKVLRQPARRGDITRSELRGSPSSTRSIVSSKIATRILTRYRAWRNRLIAIADICLRSQYQSGRLSFSRRTTTSLKSLSRTGSSIGQHI